MGVDSGESVAQKAQEPESRAPHFLLYCLLLHLLLGHHGRIRAGLNAQWVWTPSMVADVWLIKKKNGAEMMIQVLLPWHILRLSPHR